MTLFVNEQFNSTTTFPNLNVEHEEYLPANSFIPSPHGTGYQFQIPVNWRDYHPTEPGNEMRLKGLLTISGDPVPPGQTSRGNEIWVGYKVYFPTATDFTQFPITISQCLQKDFVVKDGPSFSLKTTTDGKWQLLLRAPSQSFTSSFSIVKGTWHDIVLHYKGSTTSNGKAQVWINGTTFVNYSGVTVSPTLQAKYQFYKFGMYMSALRTNLITSNMFVAYDDMKIGDANSSYNEVAPTAGEDPDPPTPPTQPEIDCVGNLLTNPDFNNGLTGWLTTADGSFEVSNSELHTSGTTAVTPFIQVYQTGLSITNGQYYTASISIKKNTGSSGSDFRLSLLQNNSPYASLGVNELFTATTEFQTFEVTFLATATEANARFRVRYDEGDFQISGICLREADGCTATANFVPTNLTIAVNDTVEFTDMSSTDDPPLTYLWNFGDGNTSTTASPSHVYTDSGAYNVTLTVEGASGCQSIAYGTINVLGTLDALFTADKTNVKLGENIQFTNTSDTDSPITQYIWNFGDGSGSTEENPIHAYGTPGNYTVKLTITTIDGQDTYIYPITITAKDFVASIVPSSLQLTFYNPEAKCYVHYDPPPNIDYVLAFTENGYEWVHISDL